MRKTTYNGVEMTSESYDDEVALRAYVFRHFSHLFTPLERRVIEYAALIVSNSEHWKVKRIYDFLENRDGHVLDNEVVAAFAIPHGERIQRALDRVLKEQLGEINQNRCPDCNRLARTPLAQQCPWCGQDWHIRT